MYYIFLTCAQVDYFAKVFSELKYLKSINIFALHGRLKQKKRTKIYDAFNNCKSGILLCTDLVARGIDIPTVEYILQYDPPQKIDFFIHRVGRTARMGKGGEAVVFLMPEEI
eukprot:UN28565